MNSPRKFPRSTMEAFPHTMEYGAAIEIPARASQWLNKIADYAFAIGLGLALAAIACWGFVK